MARPLSLRRSMLFVPGSNPAMILASPFFEADSIILDLEDAVAPSEKDAARVLVARSLRNMDFRSKEKVVRINPPATPGFEADVRAVLDAGVDTVLLPKSDVSSLEKLTEMIRKSGTGSGIIALIESARGLEEAYACARMDRVNGLFLGAEDLTQDMGMERTAEGHEIYYARWRVVLAARAAGIDAIDTPFTEFDNDEALLADLSVTRSLGFTGKACIHPNQVDIVHAALAPDNKSIAWANRVIEADERGRSMGLGAVALDGRMVDGPIVARAKSIIAKARVSGLLPKGGDFGGR